MQKLFSVIGIAAVVIIAFYLLVYSPLEAFTELKTENRNLKTELTNSQEETKQVYETFDLAMKSHLPYDKVEEIYGDSRYFNKIGSEISVASENSRQLVCYKSFR